jgi:hypothetical protein
MTSSVETNGSDNMVSGMITHMFDEISKDVRFQYIMRVEKKSTDIPTVLIGHLLLEYLMNRIIEKKCKSPKKIIEHPRDYPFSVKLQIIYSMELLPDHIFNNIAKINKIRNGLAHNLDFHETDRIIFEPSGKSICPKPRGRGNPRTFYFKTLVYKTLDQLREHMTTSLRIPVEAKEFNPFK